MLIEFMYPCFVYCILMHICVDDDDWRQTRHAIFTAGQGPTRKCLGSFYCQELETYEFSREKGFEILVALSLLDSGDA